jgi:hypothetical protein
MGAGRGHMVAAEGLTRQGTASVGTMKFPPEANGGDE